MKSIKRLYAIAAAGAMLFSLAACGQPAAKPGQPADTSSSTASTEETQPGIPSAESLPQHEPHTSAAGSDIVTTADCSFSHKMQKTPRTVKTP